MSPPEDGRRAQSQTARDQVRADLLISGLSDWVPLAEVEAVITHYDRFPTIAKLQEFALEVVESLVDDGLMQVGDLPFPGEKFKGWDLSVEAAMERVQNLFVGHHAERDLWEFTIWLGLTRAGEQLAEQLRSKKTN